MAEAERSRELETGQPAEEEIQLEPRDEPNDKQKDMAARAISATASA